MTGFSELVKRRAYERGNELCEICGFAEPTDGHHRRPRAAGGSKAADTNLLSNILMICRPCHDIVEGNRKFAFDRGWLVRQGKNPADVPVVYQGSWAVLSDDGVVFRPPTGRDRCERCGFHVPTQQHRAGCTQKED